MHSTGARGIRRHVLRFHPESSVIFIHFRAQRDTHWSTRDHPRARCTVLNHCLEALISYAVVKMDYYFLY